MKQHTDLDVWKLAMDFAEQVYRMTEDFPKHELYGLTSQLRRAAVSIPSNIAEGASRQGSKEFIQFLYIALGSTSEIETQLILANRLGYLSDVDRAFHYANRIKKMLHGLIKHKQSRDK